MGLINRRTRERIGGLRVVIRPISINLGPVYKRYGCAVIIRARRRRRRRAGCDVVIVNSYFGNFPSGTPGAPSSPTEFFRADNTSSRNARRTALSEFLIVFGAESDFPVRGVVSQVGIRIDGEERYFDFSNGDIDRDHPIAPLTRI